jgi:hypothetical protein
MLERSKEACVRQTRTAATHTPLLYSYTPTKLGRKSEHTGALVATRSMRVQSEPGQVDRDPSLVLSASFPGPRAPLARAPLSRSTLTTHPLARTHTQRAQTREGIDGGGGEEERERRGPEDCHAF